MVFGKSDLCGMIYMYTVMNDECIQFWPTIIYWKSRKWQAIFATGFWQKSFMAIGRTCVLWKVLVARFEEARRIKTIFQDTLVWLYGALLVSSDQDTSRNMRKKRDRQKHSRELIWQNSSNVGVFLYIKHVHLVCFHHLLDAPQLLCWIFKKRQSSIITARINQRRKEMKGGCTSRNARTKLLAAPNWSDLR